MKTTTTLFLSACLTCASILPAMAQQSKSKKIEIHVAKDGKSISKTYSSEEEMKNDDDLKEFLGDHGMVMVQSGDNDIIIGDSDSKHVQLITSDTKGQNVTILTEGDEETNSKVVRHENKVIMVEKSEGATVEVYSYSEEDELPEDVQKMVRENNGLAVISGNKAEKDRMTEKGTRVYPKGERFITTLDIETDLKKNELKLSFEADAKPTEIRLTDEAGKEVYKRSLPDFDGSYDETVKLKRFSGKKLMLSIEQDGKKLTEEIDLD